MTDRELLELAAKAAGITVESWTTYGPYVGGLEGEIWNPLTDDGDALRLAAKIDLLVDCKTSEFAVTEVLWPDCDGLIVEKHGADPCAATRRAIVRAAAEIAIESGQSPTTK